MMDTPFLQLSPKWRLAYDRHQWIVQRREGKTWAAVSFSASTKAVLLRVLRENGAVIDAEGQAGLDALPASFAPWRAERGNTLHSGISDPRLVRVAPDPEFAPGAPSERPIAA